MKLTDAEKASPLWLKLKEHYQERLSLLRARNDSAQTPEHTATLRGHIAEVKELLQLDKEQPVITK